MLHARNQEAGAMLHCMGWSLVQTSLAKLADSKSRFETFGKAKFKHIPIPSERLLERLLIQTLTDLCVATCIKAASDEAHDGGEWKEGGQNKVGVARLYWLALLEEPWLLNHDLDYLYRARVWIHNCLHDFLDWHRALHLHLVAGFSNIDVVAYEL